MTDEDTKIEEPQPQDNEEAKAPDAESGTLQQELEAVRKERDELLGRLQRVSADYANFQKRVPKQINDAVTYEKDKILRSLLPILDNLEHTLKTHSGESSDAVVRGVEIIYGHMLDILKSHGVSQTHSLGEPFDPARHEAMLIREEPGTPANVVVEELRKGYMIDDRLLRPTRVVVSKATTPQQAGVEDQEPEKESLGEGQDVE